MSTQSERPGLAGVWRLLDFKRTFSDNGETVDMMGPEPRGVLLLTESGRISVLVTSGARDAEAGPAALFASLMAYSGRCAVEGERFVTNVDVAWHPSWVGTEQVRFYELDGDELRIVTAEQTHPSFPGRLGRAILRWRRESSSSAP